MMKINFSKLSKNKKIIFMIITAIIAICILVALLIGTIFSTHNDDKIEQNNNQNNNNQDDNPVSLKTIQIFKDPSSDYITTSDNTYADTDNYVKVGEYSCDNNSCEVKDGITNYILIEDGDNFVLYNYTTKAKTAVFVESSEYKIASIISYNGLVYGMSLSNGEFNAFYSISQGKYITDFKYDIIYGDEGLSKGYFYANTCSSGDYYTCNAYILNIDTGEVVLASNPADTDVNWSCLVKGNTTYYVVLKGPDSPAATFYSGSFKQLMNGQEFNEYEMTDDGYIYAISNSGKTFVKFGSSGNLLYTSKTYTSVNFISKGYAGVIDTDNYLKLVDYKDNVVAKFIEWSNNHVFHGPLSGYYKSEGKPTGIYLVIEDDTIKDEANGRCKEYYYDLDKKSTGVIELNECVGYAKPVLYLYPIKEMNVTISFANPHLLTTTYPKYINNWNVTAKPNGDLYDNNDRYYYGLYWEELGSSNVAFNEGFYVTKDNAISFLEEKLSKIGLTAREANEFIMYWLPILEKNDQSLVYFELTDERQAFNALQIYPRPDSMLRLAIHIKKVNSYTKIKEEKLPTFKRNGFTVVEWGGVVH